MRMVKFMVMKRKYFFGIIIFLIFTSFVILSVCYLSQPSEIDSERTHTDDTRMFSGVTLNKGIEDQRLKTEECKDFMSNLLSRCARITISGSATNATGLHIVLIPENAVEGTDYESILKKTKYVGEDARPTASRNLVSVSNGLWSTSFYDYTGSKRVLVYDEHTHELLLEKSIYIREAIVQKIKYTLRYGIIYIINYFYTFTL
jgi:hypothetical protein